MKVRGPVTRTATNSYRIRLDRSARDAIAMFTDQLRTLLLSQDPSSDPALARLFPAAVPDDVMANLEFEHRHGDDLLRGKLEALEIVERTLARDELTEDEILAWLGAINSIRLVLGTRLEITEDSTDDDFADDEFSSGSFDLYGYLTWLEGWIIEALSQELEA